jgi:hypothetical protein
VPLDNAKGRSENFSGIGQITGFGSQCTGFLLDQGPATGPAYVMTNGHCVGIFDNTTVLRDEPARDATITFRRFHDTMGQARAVPIRAVRYATMRGTDVAVLQLGATRAALNDLAWYRLGPAPAKGADVRVVGIPVNGLAPAQQVLRVSGCTAGGTYRLLEWRWLWDAGQANDCAGIVGGSSGSPVFSGPSPLVVTGIVNTTTIGAGDRPGCYLGQPCQVDRSGVRRAPATSYAMPIAAWARCFGGSGFNPSAAGCPTERDTVEVADPQRAVRPGGTWSADVSGANPPLVKSGPAGTTNCRTAAGYAVDPDAVNAPLPQQDGFYLLCAAAAGVDGRPVLSGAGSAVVEVDGRPPTAPVRLATVVSRDDVRFEPVFDPPEYSSFQFKAGPQGAIDCADPDGYAIYRRIPLTVAIADLPAAVCVIGQDEAGNWGPPHSFVLT